MAPVNWNRFIFVAAWTFLHCPREITPRALEYLTFVIKLHLLANWSELLWTLASRTRLRCFHNATTTSTADELMMIHPPSVLWVLGSQQASHVPVHRTVNSRKSEREKNKLKKKHHTKRTGQDGMGWPVWNGRDGTPSVSQCQVVELSSEMQPFLPDAHIQLPNCFGSCTFWRSTQRSHTALHRTGWPHGPVRLF